MSSTESPLPYLDLDVDQFLNDVNKLVDDVKNKYLNSNNGYWKEESRMILEEGYKQRATGLELPSPEQLYKLYGVALSDLDVEKEGIVAELAFNDSRSLDVLLANDDREYSRNRVQANMENASEVLYNDLRPEGEDQRAKNKYGFQDDLEESYPELFRPFESEISEPNVEAYQPIMNHDYLISRLDQMYPIKIEVKEECSSDVDVWNDPGLPSPPIAESYPPSPLPCTRTRRTRAKTQVSINRAAKAVPKGTKRQRSSTAMTTRKVGNSLETSPSGSDSEDPKSPMPPPRRAPARRGAASKKGTSAKPTRSELQRNTHKQNEKMRRSQMTKMIEAVRELVPQKFYKDSRNKAKASKQKVLIAATEYVHQLKKRVVAQGQVDCKSYEYTYHNMTEELAATKAKLDKVVKKFLDKYYRVKGYHYNPKQRARR